MIVELYLRPDRKTFSDCSHDAGRFPLEEAGTLVQNVEDGRISPDSSGLWLVTVPIRIDD